MNKILLSIIENLNDKLIQYKVDKNAILNCSKYFEKLAEGELKELIEKKYRNQAI